jgi:hypothetical protein
MPLPGSKQDRDEMVIKENGLRRELGRLGVPFILISPFDSVKEQAAKIGVGNAAAVAWLVALLVAVNGQPVTDANGQPVTFE